MKLPSKCPACGDIMLTDFLGKSMVTKKCTKRLDHWIKMTSYSDEVSNIQIKVSFNPPLWATWDFFMNMIHINPVEIPKAAGLIIPIFEPDLTNYRKLIDKLKTYIVFS